jgi:hypothetical protein
MGFSLPYPFVNHEPFGSMCGSRDVEIVPALQEGRNRTPLKLV